MYDAIQVASNIPLLEKDRFLQETTLFHIAQDREMQMMGKKLKACKLKSNFMFPMLKKNCYEIKITNEFQL